MAIAYRKTTLIASVIAGMFFFVAPALATHCEFSDGNPTSFCAHRGAANVSLNYTAFRDTESRVDFPYYDDDYYVEVYGDDGSYRKVFYYDTEGRINLGRLPVANYHLNAVNWGMDCDAFDFSVRLCYECGDGNLDSGEQCDDDNRLNGDGCNASCQIEAAAAVCGNGIREAAEECDDANVVNTDSCTNVCRIARCGDGILNPVSEQCDDGNQVGGDGCDVRCLMEAPVCGNGIMQSGETCDDGNTTSGDGCGATCQVEAPAVCGNGIREGSEECDLGDGVNAVDGRCNLSCKNTYCGDGDVQKPNAANFSEECDGTPGCAANCRTAVIVPQAGFCGGAASTASCSVPIAGLCASGTASAVTYDAASYKWTWSCSGTVCGSQKRCGYTEVSP